MSVAFALPTLVRACVWQNGTIKAKAACQDFLALRKGADPTSPS